MRGGALRTGGYAFAVVLSLASAPLMVRHTGDSRFGRYTTALSVVTLVAGLTEGGLNAVAVRELSTRPAEAQGPVFRRLMGMRLAFSAASFPIALGFGLLAGYDDTLLAGIAVA